MYLELFSHPQPSIKHQEHGLVGAFPIDRELPSSHMSQASLDPLTSGVDLRGKIWNSASETSLYGNAVELAVFENGILGIRNAKHPHIVQLFNPYEAHGFYRDLQSRKLETDCLFSQPKLSIVGDENVEPSLCQRKDASGEVINLRQRKDTKRND